jgi:hypothetical protein
MNTEELNICIIYAYIEPEAMGWGKLGVVNGELISEWVIDGNLQLNIMNTEELNICIIYAYIEPEVSSI